MPTITVRDIPDVIYQDIKNLAEVERRSLNSQIIQGLSEYVLSKKSSQRIIQEIEELHKEIDVKGFELSPEEMKIVIEEGRI